MVLMAVTLGHESERSLKRAVAVNPTDGLLLDAMASSMVEDAADSLQALIRSSAAEQGLYAGNRFSPGYGDLPLDVQPRFLDALGAGKLLGISVTDGNLMIPSKSITAVIGLFEVGKGLGDGGDALGCEDADAALAGAAATDILSANVSACSELKSCETCSMHEACLLRKQGRTCYERKSR